MARRRVVRIRVLVLTTLTATLLRPLALDGQDAQVGLYHQTLFTKEGGRRITRSSQSLQGYAYLTKKTGLWGFAYREPGYASATLGLYRDFLDWFELGLAAGAERVGRSDHRFHANGRGAATMSLGASKASISLYYENGTSREGWYQLDATWRPAKRFGAGIFGQRYVGIGPRVLVRAPRVPLEIWVAPWMQDPESGAANRLLGAQLLYERRKSESHNAAPPATPAGLPLGLRVTR